MSTENEVIQTSVTIPLPLCLHSMPHLYVEEKGHLTCVANATRSEPMKSAAIHSRIDPETKKKAETILHRLGMSPTEAIRMFYTQITLRNGLPFTVEIPNEETERALEDSRSGRNLERFKSADAVIESWK